MTFPDRIVIDTVRRMWTVYAGAIAAIMFLGWITSRAFADGVSLGPAGDVFAWSMSVSWFLAFTPAIVLDAREIARLPVSRRDMWISRWWLGVAVPAGPTTIAVALATLLFAGEFSGERVALCFFYSAVYGGCYMGASALLPLRPVGELGWRPVVHMLALVLGLMLGGAAAPLWFAKHLPNTFAGLAGPMASVLIAAVGIATASYFYQPRIEPRPGRPHWKKTAPKPEARLTAGDHLTGLSFLYWRQGRLAAVLITGAIALGLLYWRVFERGASGAQFLQGAWALPFADLPSAPHPGFPLGMLLVISMMAADFDLIADMRRLRSMPLSVSRLAVILTSAGVLFAGVFWLCLLALHAVFVSSWPVTLRPDLFLIMAGGIALSQAVRMTLPVNGIIKAAAGGICSAPAFLALPFAYAPLDWSGAITLMTGGAFALALSFLINRWSIRNSSRIYKSVPVLTLFGSVTDQPR